MEEIVLTFPDGVKKKYPKFISAIEVANYISKTLAKSAIAVVVDGDIKDLGYKFNQSASIKIITNSDPEGLEVIRHDTAHILAMAINRLYENVKFGIGPVIENGFYYDILCDKIITPEDFSIIEAEMQKIQKENIPVIRRELTKEEAIDFFKNQKQNFKIELVNLIPDGEIISIYEQGDFSDLCRGPHAMTTGSQKAFKLMKVSGAYWRGDSKNQVMQRIYGTAWASKKELEDYIYMLEEAAKRDHRKLGKELDLFHIDEENPGMVFWHPNGFILLELIKNYIRHKINKAGYKEVQTPILLSNELWKKSGHWEKFRENMFILDSQDNEKRAYALKPMNCPCHVEIFNNNQRSYKELPLRMSEFGTCHRNEPSGSLHGLLRVRSFVQDDAHIFCMEDQIESEAIAFNKLLMEVYADFGFKKIDVKFSDRPEVRAGDDETWDRAEKALLDATKASGLEYELNKGEGAFYGPKLEFQLTDSLGRKWQCGTLQLDFVLPERLGAKYIAQDGSKQTPVMMHRAILGSIERFIGMIIEEYAGKFPFWLAPEQIIVMNISESSREYSEKVYKILEEDGFRVIKDLGDEKINYKIRKYSLKKIPIILVCGKEEEKNQTVNLRIGELGQYLVGLDTFRQKLSITMENYFVKLQDIF